MNDGRDQIITPLSWSWGFFSPKDSKIPGALDGEPSLIGKLLEAAAQLGNPTPVKVQFTTSWTMHNLICSAMCWQNHHHHHLLHHHLHLFFEFSWWISTAWKSYHDPWTLLPSNRRRLVRLVSFCSYVSRPLYAYSCLQKATMQPRDVRSFNLTVCRCYVGWIAPNPHTHRKQHKPFCRV